MLKFDATEASPPRDAATVVILRDAGHLEVFMVKRHPKSRFMPNAYVFPGGKVDLDDAEHVALREELDFDPVERLAEPALSTDAAVAIYFAAARETLEESGVVLGAVRDDADLDAARRSLEGGASLPTVGATIGLRFNLSALTPLARWVTPAAEPRRYDARFFITRVPVGTIAKHDERETTADAWLRPVEALELFARKEIMLAPPTLRTLELLQAFTTADEAIRDARCRRPPLVDPVFFPNEGAPYLALPGDPDHPRSERALAGTTRFCWRDDRFV